MLIKINWNFASTVKGTAIRQQSYSNSEESCCKGEFFIWTHSHKNQIYCVRFPCATSYIKKKYFALVISNWINNSIKH